MFKVGDKVKRKKEYSGNLSKWHNVIFTVTSFTDKGSSLYLNEMPGKWATFKFEKVKSVRGHLPAWW